jgi:hypothetical protein
MKNKPPFGSFVIVHKTYQRKYTEKFAPSSHNQFPSREYTREWVAEECLPARALYIGTRTLVKKGTFHYGDEDSNSYLIPETRIEVALVVLHPRTKPIYVELESLEITT